MKQSLVSIKKTIILLTICALLAFVPIYAVIAQSTTVKAQTVSRMRVFFIETNDCFMA